MYASRHRISDVEMNLKDKVAGLWPTGFSGQLCKIKLFSLVGSSMSSWSDLGIPLSPAVPNTAKAILRKFYFACMINLMIALLVLDNYTHTCTYNIRI